MKTAIVCGLLALCMTGAVWAQAGEETGNLPPGFYVRSTCVKPAKPVRTRIPEGGEALYNTDLEINNNKVRRYNKAVVAFNDCTKAYLQNADHDIQRIVSRVNGAVAQVQGTAPPPPPTAPGNMPLDFYPASPCMIPDRESLGVQPAAQDTKAMAAYNLRVTAFNDQAKIFTDCLKAYRDKAQRDIEQIRVAVQGAAAAQ